jgi:hypothetical protein
VSELAVPNSQKGSTAKAREVQRSRWQPGAGPIDGASARPIALIASAAACITPKTLCGDADKGPTEECDLGENNSPGKNCNDACKLNVCGDADKGPVEECDLGENNGPGKICNTVCRLNACGDGDKGSTEECDLGENNGPGNTCNVACELNVCGDSDRSPVEECDLGENNGPGNACNAVCKLNICGDGDRSHSEECDLGKDNNGPGKACDAQCRIPPNKASRCSTTTRSRRVRAAPRRRAIRRRLHGSHDGGVPPLRPAPRCIGKQRCGDEELCVGLWDLDERTCASLLAASQKTPDAPPCAATG